MTLSLPDRAAESLGTSHMALRAEFTSTSLFLYRFSILERDRERERGNVCTMTEHLLGTKALLPLFHLIQTSAL